MADSSLKIAIILSAVDRVSAVVNKLTDGATKKLDAFAKSTSKISDSAFTLGRQSGALGLALAAPFGIAIKSAADFQKMNVSLVTSFQGNERAAQSAFKVLNKFANETPYEMMEVTKAFLFLKNQGLDASISSLTSYGNTASAMGKSLDQMIQAVMDAATGEFERLKEFGIRANGQGKDIKFTFQGVTTHVKKNAADIQAYLLAIGKTKFAGGIVAQSKTIYGQFSTLKDNATLVAVKIGNILIPKLNELFKVVGPIVTRISNWIDRNPQLTKTIMAVVGGLAALALATSGISFLVGGLMRAVSMLSSGFSILIKTFKFLTNVIGAVRYAWQLLDLSMKANIIILIITGIALAAFLIYKNWSTVKTFFINLWEGIKNIFWKVVDWIKEWGLLFLGPIGFIIKYWDQIVDFFKNVWEKVKQKFNDFIDFVKSIPSKMFEAGKNIVKSIWEGIKSFANKPIEAIKNIAKKIRDFLPFSPAKEGALRDIHKIRLVETIAATIKPGPLVRAMRITTAAAMVAATPIAAQGVPGVGRSGSQAIHLNYNPTINVGSNTSQIDFRAELQKHSKDIYKMLNEEMRKQGRTNFNN